MGHHFVSIETYGDIKNVPTATIPIGYGLGNQILRITEQYPSTDNGILLKTKV